MTDEVMNNAVGMVATGVGLGVLGMGAGVAIKSMSKIMDPTPVIKSAKKKSSKKGRK